MSLNDTTFKNVVFRKIFKSFIFLEVPTQSTVHLNIEGMSFQTFMTFSLLWSIEEDILKNVGNQTVLVTIDFHCMDKTN